MASDPVSKVLRAANAGRSITLNPRETKLLAMGLVSAAERLLAKRRWWRRAK